MRPFIMMQSASTYSSRDRNYHLTFAAIKISKYTASHHTHTYPYFYVKYAEVNKGFHTTIVLLEYSLCTLGKINIATDTSTLTHKKRKCFHITQYVTNSFPKHQYLKFSVLSVPLIITVHLFYSLPLILKLSPNTITDL